MREDCVKSAGEAVCTGERADQLSINGFGFKNQESWLGLPGFGFQVSGSRFGYRVRGFGCSV